MDEFFRTLTELIGQYTIADMANVFAIVEGIATVVAAVGAIIAVVVTKKIASNQNKLFEEQIKIAASQTEISMQQNKIAVFNTRETVFIQLERFYEQWNIWDEEISPTYEMDPYEKKLNEMLYNYDVDLTIMYVNGMLTKKEVYLLRIKYRLKNNVPLIGIGTLIKIQRLFSLELSQLEYLHKYIFSILSLIEEIHHYEKHRSKEEELFNAVEDCIAIMEDIENRYDILSALDLEIRLVD